MPVSSTDPEGPEIRPLHPRDVPALVDLWEAAARLSHPFLTEGYVARERRNLAEIYFPLTETWVADDGGPCGFVTLDADEVAGLFVAPSHHRRGIGRALLAHAHDRRGTLTVEVLERNPQGRAFYAACGFRPVGRRRHDELDEPLLQLAL